MEVTYKFSPGDKVLLKTLEGLGYGQLSHRLSYDDRKNYIPVEYTIDGYGYDIDEQGNHHKYYLLHAYCDKYIEYHGKFSEDCFDSADGDNHEMIVDIRFEDLFGEPIELGDTIYEDVYSLRINRDVPLVNAEWGTCRARYGTVYAMEWKVEFPMKNDLLGYGNNPVIEFHYEHCWPTTYMNGEERRDSLRYGARNRGSKFNTIKKILETIVDDYCQFAKQIIKQMKRSESEKFEWERWFKHIGIYDEVMTKLEAAAKKKSDTRKKTDTKKGGKKSASKKKAADIDNKLNDILSSMSDEEKLKMLEMLKSSK